MCRACAAAVLAPASEHARIRRAAGLEVQVVDLVEGPKDLNPAVALDVIIVLGDTDPGRTGPALLAVNDAKPPWADLAIPDGQDLGERLPGAVVRALIARRGR